MPDNKCWMVDNLKYANFGIISQEDGKHLTVDGTNVDSGAANFDVAKYVDPNSTIYCKGNTNMPTATNTRCGLLYNWYAATNGTGTYDLTESGIQAGGSICPTGFRLPSSVSGIGGPTTEGSSKEVADFPVLNASMAVGFLTTGNDASTTYNEWQSSGA